MKTLREHRNAAFLSLRDLARKADVQESTIWRIETGASKKLQPSTMRKIADALGVHPLEITEFTQGGK